MYKECINHIAKLSLVGLVDAARVDPEVLEIVALCLFSTEDDLVLAWLYLAIACLDVCESHLVSVCSLGV
jgi:hypothetical protein